MHFIVIQITLKQQINNSGTFDIGYGYLVTTQFIYIANNGSNDVFLNDIKFYGNAYFNEPLIS